AQSGSGRSSYALLKAVNGLSVERFCSRNAIVSSSTFGRSHARTSQLTSGCFSRAVSMPAMGPMPLKRSTTCSKRRRSGSSACSGRVETNVRSTCRSSRSTQRRSCVLPSRVSRALSRPMRRLSPPASTSPQTGSFAGIIVVLLAAAFRYQARFPDDYLVGQSLAHVVDRQCGHGGARQRFHLHAGTVVYLASAVDHRPVSIIHADSDAAVVEPEGMTERNELMRPLRTHDARNDRGGEYGAFRRGDVPIHESLCDGFRKFHDGARVRNAIGCALVADIDDRGPFAGMYVAQFVQGVSRMRACASPKPDGCG